MKIAIESVLISLASRGKNMKWLKLTYAFLVLYQLFYGFLVGDEFDKFARQATL